VFFFSNREALETERYEFHISKKSQVANNSYIYMLYLEENVDLDLLGEYMDKQPEELSDKQQEN
jgi:hypothetical protein